MRGSVISVTHGGGPLPVLGDPRQAALATSMRTKIPPVLKLATSDAPRAIVLVTAHWETDKVTISSGERPELLYDYGGFPPEAYELKYPAPGSREVAALVKEALGKEGIEGVLDEKRGWDHGVFVPMLLIHPAADVPIVQVSVLKSQDPAELYAMGRALAPLRDQNIAIVGSGSASLHNMQLMMQAFRSGGPDSEGQETHRRWNAALNAALFEPDVAKRKENIVQWRRLEGSYMAQPKGRAEHFSPLIVCAGAAGEDETHVWSDPFVGYTVFTHYWI